MIRKEKVTQKERIYTGNFLSLEKWHTILSNNESVIREIVIPHNAVGIVPIDKNGQIHLIRQARPAVDDVLYEIPAGVIDANESMEETARRECCEEVELYPRSLRKLVTYYHAEGYTTGIMTLFLGTNLKPYTQLKRDVNEILEHISIPFNEAQKWVRQGRFKDSKSMLGIMLSEKLL